MLFAFIYSESLLNTNLLKEEFHRLYKAELIKSGLIITRTCKGDNP